MDIVKEKINQATKLLDELGLDCWIIFVRETAMASDPTLPMVVGLDVVWQSFFIYTRSGEAIAVVGNFDQEDFRRSKRFTEVIPYTEGVSQDFRKILNRLDPQQIAVNFSTNNVAADGLTHGMFMLLTDYLKKTPYADCIVSAEDLISKLRSRKLPSELKLLEKAATAADETWHKAVKKIKPGMTEKEIAALIDKLITETGDEPSFPTLVNAGGKSTPGHSEPTDAKLAAGDLLHVDFGVRHQHFCSDIQRLLYIKRPRETAPPDDLTRAFDRVSGIITETGTLCKPGAKGFEVDDRARELLKAGGYPEYQHALGHQLGRDVHDGGAIIGPKWERYGITPTIPLEPNNVFTLELEVILPKIGCVGLEEDVCVTDKGARFLGPRQTELAVK